MAVNVSRLWRDGVFQSYTPEAKLLYIYLVTSPNLNSLGLLNITPNSAMFDLEMEEAEFRRACKLLTSSATVSIFKVSGQVYFFITAHFATLPKSITVSKRATKDLTALPDDVKEELDRLGLTPDIEKHSEFIPPTTDEVEQYSLSKGYLVNAQEFIEFYENGAKRFGKKGWYDSRGKSVKDWRAKLRKVWFKDENKLKECKDAPKGYEFFAIKYEGGLISPDFWSKGLPMSKKGLAPSKMLQREYKAQSQK
jgi:hypothetical protein